MRSTADALPRRAAGGYASALDLNVAADAAVQHRYAPTVTPVIATQHHQNRPCNLAKQTGSAFIKDNQRLSH